MSRPEDDRHKAKMVKRKAVQDAEVAAKPILEKGLLIVHTGPARASRRRRSGSRCARSGGAFGSAWCSSSRAPGRPASAWASSASGPRSNGARWARASPGRRKTAPATSRRRCAAWGEARRMMADPSIRLLVLDELNIALRYDYLPLAEVVAALGARRPRSACRRHRPQRQAGADRGGRLRHRIHPRQASLRRRACARRRRSSFDRPGADVSGHGIGRRQIADRRRPLPRVRQARASRPAVQAAEHVEQRRGDAGRRRDRPRPGAAGARLQTSPRACT